MLGFVADRLLGDPQRLHPVAGFGSVAAALEDRLHADSRARGAAHVAVLLGGAAALGICVERSAPGRVTRALVTAAATWAVLGGRSLEREAEAVHSFLVAGDLPAARQRLTHLVGRDTSALDAQEVQDAGERVSQYVQDNCGLDVGS